MQDADKTRFEEALSLHRGGQPDLAEPVYRDLMERYPEDAELNHLLGVVCFQSGDPSAAVAWVEKAIAIDDGEAMYFNTVGAALSAAERFGEAETALRRGLELDPDFADAAYNLGNALFGLGRLDEAEAAFQRAVELDSSHVDALNNLSALLKGSGRRGDAVEFLRRAAALAPGNADVLFNLAESLERLNLRDEAARVVADLLAVSPESSGGNILAARLERHKGDYQAAARRLRALAARALEPEFGIRARFDLGQTLDRMDAADEAFAEFEAANRLSEEATPLARVNREAYRKRLERDRAWFTAERLEAAPAAREDAPGPVFLVGFPRSGTTLIEQMLDAHPDLATTGERSPLDRLRQMLEAEGRYPRCLEDASPAEFDGWREAFAGFSGEVLGERWAGRRLVDKMPLNIADVGLIGYLFPEARVVTSLRDPRDVCLSCFMQQFDLNQAMSGFTGLETTVELYARVMESWLHYRRHTRVAWMEYRYEDLVADFEGVVRSILDFLGLPWRPEILDYRQAAVGRDISTPSYESVVEPLYARANGRWTRYREHLAPHLATLAPFVEEFGYEPG